jgi:hypothetical protein
MMPDHLTVVYWSAPVMWIPVIAFVLLFLGLALAPVIAEWANHDIG